LFQLEWLQRKAAFSAEECRVIRDAVRREKRVLQTGTWQRSGRNFRHACQLARNGYFGKIHKVKVAAPGPGYQPTYTASVLGMLADISARLKIKLRWDPLKGQFAGEWCRA